MKEFKLGRQSLCVFWHRVWASYKAPELVWSLLIYSYLFIKMSGITSEEERMLRSIKKSRKRPSKCGIRW